MEIDNENVVQAIVIMDTFNNNFVPISNTRPLGLFKVAGVPLIDYILESLALGGVGECVLFCCQNGTLIKDHVSKCIEKKSPWTLNMDVQVMTSDTCRTMGDAMREIDAAGIIRGCFILTGVNTVTNVPFASLLEKHKQLAKSNKGAAMTLVYKELAWEHPLLSSDRTTFLAANGISNRVLMHQKYKPKSKEQLLNIPLDIIFNSAEVKLHHNLSDANIALCSPSVPPLFSDNFDFQSRDDFIHGILINEEILASSLYYTLLKNDHYAATVSNWKTYQIISRDILHHWAHPLSIETGLFYQNNFICMNNHTFRHKSSTLSRSCQLVADNLIGENAHIDDNSVLSKSSIGKNCKIGKNVIVTGSQIMDNVIIKDNCKILNSFIDEDCVVEEESVLECGSILGPRNKISKGHHIRGKHVENADNDNDKSLMKSTSETEWENESSGNEDEEFIAYDKVWSDSDTCYSSDSSAESSLPDSPAPEDTNIFLQEVIDSLARGYDEKLKCDYLILEINSSRYAYNIQLHEVNFFVVRAILSLPILSEAANPLVTIKDVLKFFKPVLVNYIKSKSSIMDCLKAVEESCIKCEWLNNRAGQLVHMLYEADIVDEDSLLEWQKDLKQDESPIVNQTSLLKFFDWIQQASEESESD